MITLSLRGKFALWAGLLAGIVVVFFAVGTQLNLYHEQIEAVDNEVDLHRRQILALGAEALRTKSPDELVGLEPLLGVAVCDPFGNTISRSAGLGIDVVHGVAGVVPPHTMRDAAGTPLRVSTFRMGDHTVLLAYRLSDVFEVLHSLILSYLLSLPVVLVVAAIGGWWIAGRALVPLRVLAKSAENIGIEALDRRIPAASTVDEIGRLTAVLNAMLDRIEQGFKQAKRFAADASHELRTPLTIIHGEIDRLLRAPGLDASIETKLLSLQEEVARLDRITQHLLLLARFDGGNVSMERESIDFSALVVSVCEDAELLAAGCSVRLATHLASGLVVKGDSAHLRRAVLALLDNAIRYNKLAGRVQCSLAVADAAATANASAPTPAPVDAEPQNGTQTAFLELRVGNSGPAIPPEARGQMFQRFFRVDPSRQRGGHGLGLSLAREIVRAHGGDIVLAPEREAGWNEFILTLPLCS